MALKSMQVFAVVYLLVFFIRVESSFIKGKNIPRVGRSDESTGFYDQGTMGYVIKTMPSKNIPRLGRRNYNSEYHYDIPKLERFSLNPEYEDDDIYESNQEQSQEYYENQLRNMKK